MWYEHPEDPFAGPWETHIISDDVGDVFLIEATLQAEGKSYDVIFTTGYFSEQLAVHWTNHPDGLWDDNSQVLKVNVSWTFDIIGMFYPLFSIFTLWHMLLVYCMLVHYTFCKK